MRVQQFSAKSDFVRILLLVGRCDLYNKELGVHWHSCRQVPDAKLQSCHDGHQRFVHLQSLIERAVVRCIWIKFHGSCDVILSCWVYVQELSVLTTKSSSKGKSFENIPIAWML